MEVAVVGAGSVANVIHAPAWRSIKKAKLIAICDTNGERAKRFAEIWKVPRIYTDFDTLLEEEKNALIDICIPPNLHAQLALKAMRSGHHVILEKPMALSLDDCEQILSEWKRNKAKICVIHNYLFEPPMLKVRSLIKNLDILSVDIRMLHTVEAVIPDRNHWVHNLPGGMFGECLIHPIYMLRNIVGKLNVRDVYATKRGPYDWVKYDELHVTLDSNGKFCTVHISFNSPRWSYPFHIKVYSKELLLTYDGTNQSLIIQKYLPPFHLRGIGKYRLELEMLSDAISSSWQTTGSVIKSIYNKTKGAFLNRRLGSGHVYLFNSFVNGILENKEEYYHFEEAYCATKTYLKILDILSKM